MHVRVLHKSFFQMICSYFNIAFLINQPSVDISKPILLRSTIPRIALANVELFLFIFTTVFVTKSFLRPPRTPPVLPHPRRGRGSAPTLPRPLKPKCSLPPHFASFSLAAPLGGSAAKRQRGCRWYFLSRHHSTNRTPSATRQEPPDGGCSLAWRLRAHKSALTGCQLPHRGAKKTLRIRPGFHKTAGACRNPSAAAAAAQLCIKRLYAVKDGYTR